MKGENNIMILYHGSDHVVERPLYGVGKQDNDYGSGFYTTKDKEKADQWALVNGSDRAITNCYSIDESNLQILDLDEYGTLAWIAEIVHHRGARGEKANIIAGYLIEKYKVDTSQADIIIGYRADDSYIDVVDSFLKNELSLEDVERLFKKAELGQQVFIKSKKAFDALVFEGYEQVLVEPNNDEIQARIDVSRFLRNRATEIQINGFIPDGITATSAIKDTFCYNKEYNYYSIMPKDDDSTQDFTQNQNGDNYEDEDYDEGWDPGDE